MNKITEYKISAQQYESLLKIPAARRILQPGRAEYKEILNETKINAIFGSLYHKISYYDFDSDTTYCYGIKKWGDQDARDLKTILESAPEMLPVEIVAFVTTSIEDKFYPGPGNIANPFARKCLASPTTEPARVGTVITRDVYNGKIHPISSWIGCGQYPNDTIKIAPYPDGLHSFLEYGIKNADFRQKLIAAILNGIGYQKHNSRAR